MHDLYKPQFSKLIANLDKVDPKLCDELLMEVGGRNNVRVTVHRAKEIGKRVSRTSELVHDTKQDFKDLAVRPSQFLMLDSMRMAWGLKPRWIPAAYEQLGAEFVDCTPNLRTTIGIDVIPSAVSDASGSRAPVVQYIALSNNTNVAAAANTTDNTTNTRICWGTASATDAAASTSRGEYTALGLQRAVAAYAHTPAATLWTLTKQFTATSAITNVQACGAINSATQGAASALTSDLFLENVFTATSLVTNDQITITWTVNDV